jgi:hypothetical protein
MREVGAGMTICEPITLIINYRRLGRWMNGGMMERREGFVQGKSFTTAVLFLSIDN